MGQTACKDKSRVGVPERSDQVLFFSAKKQYLLPLHSDESLSERVCICVCMCAFVESKPVVAEPVNNVTLEKVPEITTANPIPPTESNITMSSVSMAAAGEIFIYSCVESSTPKNKVEK